MTTLTERDMRRALGLVPERSAPVAEAPSSMRVTLSVRHPDGGLPFKYEHRSKTISRTLAVINAQRSAREQGLRVYALLDVEG
jgi:hypothetical protein